LSLNLSEAILAMSLSGGGTQRGWCNSPEVEALSVSSGKRDDSESLNSQAILARKFGL